MTRGRRRRWCQAGFAAREVCLDECITVELEVRQHHLIEVAAHIPVSMSLQREDLKIGRKLARIPARS